MAEEKSPQFLVLLGYELTTWNDEAVGMKIVYGEAKEAPTDADPRTPVLFLMPDEARSLARDLLAAADSIDGEGRPPDALH